MLVLTDQGGQVILGSAVRSAETPWTLRLFTNRHVPDPTDRASDYREADGAGYTALPLLLERWTAGDGRIAERVYPPETFIFTGPLMRFPDVYGYYVTGSEGTLLFAEAFSQTFTPMARGDKIRIAPRITLSAVA